MPQRNPLPMAGGVPGGGTRVIGPSTPAQARVQALRTFDPNPNRPPPAEPLQRPDNSEIYARMGQNRTPGSGGRAPLAQGAPIGGPGFAQPPQQGGMGSDDWMQHMKWYQEAQKLGGAGSMPNQGQAVGSFFGALRDAQTGAAMNPYANQMYQGIYTNWNKAKQGDQPRLLQPEPGAFSLGGG